jgi:hypothetical protein
VAGAQRYDDNRVLDEHPVYLSLFCSLVPDS